MAVLLTNKAVPLRTRVLFFFAFGTWLLASCLLMQIKNIQALCLRCMQISGVSVREQSLSISKSFQVESRLADLYEATVEARRCLTKLPDTRIRIT